MIINLKYLSMLSWHLIILLLGPIFAIGVINRTKACMAGRKGPSLYQSFFDLKRLLKKQPVYSHVTSWVFQIGPWIVLATSFMSGLLSPIIPSFSPISFSFDFVYFAYLLAFGRAFIILAAMDTGSSFEGMGASREATFSALIEPALFLSIASLCLMSSSSSFQTLMMWPQAFAMGWLVKLILLIPLFILLQIEVARVPVDDPNTHLELTMIHEVLILDHSGPELAALQYGVGMKLIVLSGIIAALLNPLTPEGDGLMLSFIFSMGIMALVMVAVGLIESLMARFKLKVIPVYAGVGVFMSALSLLITIVLWGSK